MCFGKDLKGEDPSSGINNDHYNSRPVENKPRESFSKMPNNDSYSPPTGPPPSHAYHAPTTLSSNNPYATASGEYAAPSGPPPSHIESYAPPPGPPPPHTEYAPPAGPPSKPKQEPYHDWETAVPDTSLLPPPPSVGNQRSATNNATEQEAEQGDAWCNANPMRGPLALPAEALYAIQAGEIGVIKPRSYNGSLDRPRPGVWAGKTKSNCPDSCISSAVPLYSVIAHSPLNTGQTKTIYYEVRINKRNRQEVSLAMGFAAPPYPTFRLPGWHRGCLAVHGDDGSKFINDRWGGNDFTAPFKSGETLGIGMTLSKDKMDAPPAYGQAAPAPLDIEIFFTRDGRKTGGWNLHGERDAVEDLPVTGLEGLHDLYAAVGVFDNVEFEIVFSQGEWMYHP
jgi:hypothetical protein